jgi:hypothetical protein
MMSPPLVETVPVDAGATQFMLNKVAPRAIKQAVSCPARAGPAAPSAHALACRKKAARPARMKAEVPHSSGIPALRSPAK